MEAIIFLLFCFYPSFPSQFSIPSRYLLSFTFFSFCNWPLYCLLYPSFSAALFLLHIICVVIWLLFHIYQSSLIGLADRNIKSSNWKLILKKKLLMELGLWNLDYCSGFRYSALIQIYSRFSICFICLFDLFLIKIKGQNALASRMSLWFHSPKRLSKKVLFSFQCKLEARGMYTGVSFLGGGLFEILVYNSRVSTSNSWVILKFILWAQKGQC